MPFGVQGVLCALNTSNDLKHCFFFKITGDALNDLGHFFEKKFGMPSILEIIMIFRDRP